EMNVRGLMNMQYAIEGDKVYVLEANPRASRTVPLVSKVCDIRMVPLATEIITMPLTGRPSPVKELKDRTIPHYGVKEAVFPFNMFQEVDPVLGPEMRSTGEVLGMASTFGEAFSKSQEATQTLLPTSGKVLLSVNDRDKAELVELAQGFKDCGFELMATSGCCKFLAENGIEAEKIEATEEEVEAKIAEQAASVEKTAEEYKKNMDPRQIDYIRNDIIITKLFDFLKANNEMYLED
ncbi:MAG: hypothetical protein J6A46_01535, partial [Clostridia bacterium]|nr:hypothetical protein [Clostridia bacterium]